MKNLKGPFLVRVQLVNATQKSTFGIYRPGEVYGPYPDLRSVYAEMKTEWGGKVTAMYRESRDGDHRVGWVFRKRDKYSDSSDTYIREAWVEVIREVEPERPAVYQSVHIN